MPRQSNKRFWRNIFGSKCRVKFCQSIRRVCMLTKICNTCLSRWCLPTRMKMEESRSTSNHSHLLVKSPLIIKEILWMWTIPRSGRMWISKSCRGQPSEILAKMGQYYQEILDLDVSLSLALAERLLPSANRNNLVVNNPYNLTRK